jgi:hypothetical protein
MTKRCQSNAKAKAKSTPRVKAKTKQLGTRVTSTTNLLDFFTANAIFLQWAAKSLAQLKCVSIVHFQVCIAQQGHVHFGLAVYLSAHPQLSRQMQDHADSWRTIKTSSNVMNIMKLRGKW